MPSLPDRAAARAGADPDAVRRLLTDDVFRVAYWGGDLPEAAFWEAVGVPVPDERTRRRVLDLKPLIDPARVADWNARADVWVISNHRHEWLLPVLARTGLADAVDRVVVSSTSGRVKPDPAAWAVLMGDGVSPGDVFVVDDQVRNLDAARSLGMTAVLAVGDLSWADEVDGWLAAQHRAATR
ncbi:MAG: HAD family hydrolase [Thermoleophilia bacterium]|nr:HAD family hydrolase [Thermoleophilia bacterium]